MRIDTHCNIGRFGERDLTADDVSTYLDQVGFGLALVANLDAASRPVGSPDRDEVDANEACLTACNRDPRLLPLYWVRPGRRDSNVYAMAGALATESFAGTIFAPARNDYAADASILDPYMHMLAKSGTTAIFCTSREDRSGPARVYSLARRHPKVSIVLSGIASDVHVREAVDVVQKASERNDARLYLNTSHAGAEEIVRLVKSVGAERVVFASDWPQTRSDASLGATSIASALADLLPAATCERLFGGNAQHLFHCRIAETV